MFLKNICTMDVIKIKIKIFLKKIECKKYDPLSRKITSSQEEWKVNLFP